MLSHYYDCYKDTAAYNDATSMPVILENGRKVFGPPHRYSGPQPSHVCELYITRIPPQLNELGFLVWLHHIGQVYAFRLMMDSGNTTRGYAFVRFCNEENALAAFELIKYLYVDGERLSVFRSQGKNRLFVSGIPRELPLSSLEVGFKMCFPSMQSCTAYPAIKNKFFPARENEENRGFAFIEFEDHEIALAAKKRLNTGRIGMWGADLKIQWAKPKEEMQVASGSRQYRGVFSSRPLPCIYTPNDYCAKLRLYCLANHLCIPVVVYGACFRFFKLQYAGVLLKNSFNENYSYILIEIQADNINDIHLLICEIAVKIMEQFKAELRYNAIVRVINDTKAELVYTFKNCEELKNLKLQNIVRYPNVMFEFAVSMEILGLQNHEKLLFFYKRSFLTHQPVATFSLETKHPLAQYCAVLPKFRNNKKLTNNFNDLEITLLLRSSATAPIPQQLNSFEIYKQIKDNMITKDVSQEPAQQQQQQKLQVPVNIQCFSLRSQHGLGFGIKYNTLNLIDIMSVKLRECYHPEQRVNSNPIWIGGHSYRQSIYN